MSDMLHCRACGRDYSADASHCPHCLTGIHDADMYDEACGGRLVPIGVWVKEDHTWEVLGKCSLCGEIAATPVAAEDNPTILLSLAHRPLACPPFPLEKIDEMTAAMGGTGDMGGYDA